MWDTRNELAWSCNTGTVELERLEGREELGYVRSLVEKHQRYTGSEVAAKVLKAWELASRQLVKVMPREYERVLIERARREGAWRDGEDRPVAKGVA